MEYLIGVLVALAVVGLATSLGWDRDRSFGPTVLIVIAAYYVLFATMGGSDRTLAIELSFAAGFLALAIIGFKTNLWLVAVGMVGHGVFDLVHHLVIANPGVPSWWPGFCLAADVPLGGWLAVMLIRRSHPSLDKT